MASARDGGPAFPIPNVTDMDGYVYAPEARGMSLRDWFAGQALADMASLDREEAPLGPADIALEAYAIADAMLAARNAPESAQEPADGEIG